MGSGGASVGRVVASDTRNVQFESSYQQILFSIKIFIEKIII